MCQMLYNQLVLVDDDVIILKSTERILSDYFVVKSFLDPRKAIQYLMESERDKSTLIISDARMPYIGGIELLTEATKLSPLSSRIILTGFKDFKVAKDAVNKGKVHYFLTKPVHPIHLIHSAISAAEISKIRRLVSNYSLQPVLVKESFANLKAMQEVFENIDESENKLQSFLSFYKNYYKALRYYQMGKWEECLALLTMVLSSEEAPLKAVYIRGELLKAQVSFSFLATEKSLQKSKNMLKTATKAMKNAMNTMAQKNMEFLLHEAMDSFPELMSWAIKRKLLTQKLLDVLGASVNTVKNQEFTLKVYTLGTFEIYYTGNYRNLNSQLNHKERMLLTYLLSWSGSRIPIDIILEQFWPDKNEKKAMSNFYTTLYKLRKALEPGLKTIKQSSFVKYQDGFCWIDYQLVWTDDRQLVLHIKQAQHEYDKNQLDDFMATCQNVYDRYKGGYLPDYLYEDWIVDRREWIQDQWIKIMVLWVSRLLLNGNANEAHKICKRILEVDQGAGIYLNKLISPNEQLFNEYTRR